MAESPDAAKLLVSLDEALRGSGILEYLRRNQNWWRSLFVSDSLIMANSVDPRVLSVRDELRGIAQQAAMLQFHLLERDFFLRGALSVGQFHWHDDVMFGAALVDAVRAEHSTAKHPRIVLASSATELLGVAPTVAGDAFGGLIAIDHDDVMYVDYLQLYDNTRAPAERESYFRIHRDIVAARLERHRNEPGIFEKYEWLAKYHNGFCKDGQGLDHLLIKDVASDYSPLVRYRRADRRYKER